MATGLLGPKPLDALDVLQRALGRKGLRIAGGERRTILGLQGFGALALARRWRRPAGPPRCARSRRCVRSSSAASTCGVAPAKRATMNCTRTSGPSAAAGGWTHLVLARQGEREDDVLLRVQHREQVEELEDEADVLSAQACVSSVSLELRDRRSGEQYVTERLAGSGTASRAPKKRQIGRKGPRALPASTRIATGNAPPRGGTGAGACPAATTIAAVISASAAKKRQLVSRVCMGDARYRRPAGATATRNRWPSRVTRASR